MWEETEGERGWDRGKESIHRYVNDADIIQVRSHVIWKPGFWRGRLPRDKIRPQNLSGFAENSRTPFIEFPDKVLLFFVSFFSFSLALFLPRLVDGPRDWKHARLAN